LVGREKRWKLINVKKGSDGNADEEKLLAKSSPIINFRSLINSCSANRINFELVRNS